MADIQLFNLIDVDSPPDVLEEVRIIWNLCFPGGDFSLAAQALADTVDLFAGRFPGFRAANTGYHDLSHATGTFLAMARLIHGALLDGRPLPPNLVRVALIAGLWHDSGLIQETGDMEGTGAKYTAVHVSRSEQFFARYGRQAGLTAAEIEAGRWMIHLTDLNVGVTAVFHQQTALQLLAQCLATADLIAQMADRAYLEKLLYLYHEFREGQIDGLQGEVDFLQQSPQFYQFIQARLSPTAVMTGHFLRLHFAARWRMDENLYQSAIERQRQYLKKILAIPNADPRDHLRRKEVVKKVRELYGDSH